MNVGMQTLYLGLRGRLRPLGRRQVRRTAVCRGLHARMLGRRLRDAPQGRLSEALASGHGEDGGAAVALALLCQ